MGTAYLASSPGAMSALLVVALDSGKDAAVITCFHFFRGCLHYLDNATYL